MFTCFTFLLLCSLGKVVNVHVTLLEISSYILLSYFLPIVLLHIFSILLFLFIWVSFHFSAFRYSLLSFESVFTINLLLLAVFFCACCITQYARCIMSCPFHVGYCNFLDNLFMLFRFFTARPIAKQAPHTVPSVPLGCCRT